MAVRLNATLERLEIEVATGRVLLHVRKTVVDAATGAVLADLGSQSSSVAAGEDTDAQWDAVNSSLVAAGFPAVAVGLKAALAGHVTEARKAKQ